MCFLEVFQNKSSAVGAKGGGGRHHHHQLGKRWAVTIFL